MTYSESIVEDGNVDESIHGVDELSDLSNGDRLSDQGMRFDSHSSQEVVTENEVA